MIQTHMYTLRGECVSMEVWLVGGGTNKLKLQLTIIECQSIIIIWRRAILYLTV